MKYTTSSKQVYAVAKALESVLGMATRKRHLDMLETNVISESEGHTCGTIHCHGGWYTIAKNLHLHHTGYVGFSKGAEQMSLDLGFPNMDELEEWAKNNPEIWGNDRGLYLFSCPSAFKHPKLRPNGAKNLQDIINHWNGVGDRLKALETPQYPNITKELAKPAVDEVSDLVKTKEVCLSRLS